MVGQWENASKCTCEKPGKPKLNETPSTWDLAIFKIMFGADGEALKTLLLNANEKKKQGNGKYV